MAALQATASGRTRPRHGEGSHYMSDDSLVRRIMSLHIEGTTMTASGWTRPRPRHEITHVYNEITCDILEQFTIYYDLL